MIFEGKVVTGEGNGKKFLALPWVKQQIKEKTGFVPFAGTLNLKLSRESIGNRIILEQKPSDAICPDEGYCLGLLFKAEIEKIASAVIIPQVKNYPENILEIIAHSNLRKKLKLKDGDEVSISVFT